MRFLFIFIFLLYSCGGKKDQNSLKKSLIATYALSNTNNGLRLTAQLNSIGTVYYAIYDADPGILTAADIKTDSSAIPAGTLVAGGSLAITSANTDFTIDDDTLAEKKIYWFRAVAENAKGLDIDADIKSADKILPLGPCRI